MPKRLLAIVLIITLTLGLAGMARAEDREQPGYQIRGQVDGQAVSVEISIENIRATVGRFALYYNPEVLTLLQEENGSYVPFDTPDLKKVIKPSGAVTITPESLKEEQTVSQEAGRVMFAWYASNQYVEAKDAPQVIATLQFQIKEGAGIEDFNFVTLGVANIKKGEINSDWDTGAYIAAGSYEKYKYNVENFPQCKVSKTYPNWEVQPVYTYEVRFEVKDSGGRPVSGAMVSIGETACGTDENGVASAALVDGEYSYAVTKEGFREQVGSVRVRGEKTEAQVTLQSYEEYLREQLETISIAFVQGESADRVKSHIGLPSWEENGIHLQWQSSKPEIITNAGAVIRPEHDTPVTMTAVLSKGEIKVTRDYPLSVLGTYVPPGETEKPSDEPGNESRPNTRPGGGGGPTATKGPEASAAPVPTGTPEPEPESYFKDLDPVPWAQEAIIKLALAGIVNGTSETTFSPEASIKRGDFVALLMRMLKFETEGAENFADVGAESYYAGEIAQAKALDIARGVDGANFAPEHVITRQDMMVITCRALEKKGTPVKAGDLSVLNQYTDREEIASYAVQSMADLVGEQLISGTGEGKLSPNGITTRAEVAVFLFRIYEKQNH